MPDFMLIDAFADTPFTGNPAAVVRGMLDDALMQKIAMEFNQAETAFVMGLPDGGFALRWFTPKAEVSLCGHATLAAARALFDWGDAAGDRINFATRMSGQLSCSRSANGALTLDFPVTPPAPCPPPIEARRTLGISGTLECVGRTDMSLTLLLESETQVRAASPDLRALRNWHPVGVIVTAPSEKSDADYVSRYFAPAVGIDEDPATGSSHCALVPFWSKRLNKRAMVARQLSSRGATFRVELVGDRVTIGGGTIVTATGTLSI